MGSWGPEAQRGLHQTSARCRISWTHFSWPKYEAQIPNELFYPVHIVCLAHSRHRPMGKRSELIPMMSCRGPTQRHGGKPSSNIKKHHSVVWGQGRTECGWADAHLGQSALPQCSFHSWSSCHILWLLSMPLINCIFHDSYCLIASQMGIPVWSPHEGRLVGLWRVLSMMLQSYS